MGLRIKSKIALGLLFIFSLILVNGGMGYYYLNRLASASDAIIRDNYLSVQYCRQMSGDLMDLTRGDPRGLEGFNQALTEEDHDITEPGEGEMAGELRSLYDQAIAKGPSPDLIQRMQGLVFQIQDVNMKAILRKNRQAHATAGSALVALAIITTVSFLIGFTILLNFPGYIGNPVRQLTESIKAIADHRYSERIHFSSRDEFGELARAFNTMAARLDEYEGSNLARISFEKKRIETLINDMKDAIIGLDETNHILFANPMARSLLNMEGTDLIGAYAPDAALGNALLHRLLEPGDSGQLLRIFSGGRESYFTRDILSVQINDPGDAEAQPVNAGRVVILKNITRFQELDMAKTNFIATISHELKTPIASIKMSLKLLEDVRIGNLNQEQRELLDQVAEDSQRLLAITKELLDLAQVETGNISLSSQPTTPALMMDYAVQAVNVQASSRNVRVERQGDPMVSLVMADPEKTAWVLVNFLSNAIRYSPEGARVLIGAYGQEGGVVFFVQDFGPGIDPKYREKVFEKFFRVPGSQSRGGTGLGLAISREFIQAQGGKVWVNSEPGKGSTFCFSLPSVPALKAGPVVSDQSKK